MEVQIETQTNAPICKTQTCKRPLTYLEASKCWRCLICNPIPKNVPKPKKEKKFLDVAMTEKRVAEMIREAGKDGILSENTLTEIMKESIREIVQDELMNWHIPKPPVTKEEVNAVLSQPVFPDDGELVASKVEKIDWRQQAKELGIPLFHRKKEEVLAEIKEKTKEIADGGRSGSQD